MLFSKNEHPNSLKALENKEKRQVLYLPFALVIPTGFEPVLQP